MKSPFNLHSPTFFYQLRLYSNFIEIKKRTKYRLDYLIISDIFWIRLQIILLCFLFFETAKKNIYNMCIVLWMCSKRLLCINATRRESCPYFILPFSEKIPKHQNEWRTDRGKDSRFEVVACILSFDSVAHNQNYFKVSGTMRDLSLFRS